LIVFQKNEVV